MNWEQKLHALNALAECSLRCRKPGDWYVEQRTEIGGDGVLTSAYGNGVSPTGAINDHWKQLVDELPRGKYIVLDTSTSRRHVRWNGFMWIDLPVRKPA